MTPILAFLGGWEIAAILVVGLLLFGTRLPKIARSFGQSVNEFKQGMKDAPASSGASETEEPAEKTK